MLAHKLQHDSDLNQDINDIENEIVSNDIDQDLPMKEIPLQGPTVGFDKFDIPHALIKSLDHLKYTSPTPIQQQAIPAVMKGKDLLASAQTGTGKTGAFMIPILSKLMVDTHAMAIIMAPTRELAAQILAVAHAMAHGHQAIKTALLIGGESMGRQRAQLSARPRLIVGTPGRMNDHLRSNPRMYEKTSMLVLDEADRMLDMGFAPQIKEIIQTTNPKRQTLMFSATFPDNIQKFAQQYLRDPIRISIEPERTSAANIKHEELHTSEGARYGELVRELNKRQGSIIVFIKTKHGADRMVKKLQDENLGADVIHGGLNQRQRDRAIAGFRNGKSRIMIATDVAARGLDVPHIEHVINYDLPQVPEDYVHRIGRTGRNGKEGTALSFIMPSENGKWRAIQRILNPNAAPAGRGEKREGGRGGNSRGGSRGGFSNGGGFRGRSEGGRSDGGRYESRGRSEGGRSEGRFENRAPRFEPRMDDMSSEGQRSEPRRESNSFGDRPRNDRPFGDKPRFDKPRGDRPYGDKPRFDAPRGEGNFRPREDRPFGDQPRGERSFGDKPRFDAPRGERTFGDKPRGERSSFGDRPRFDKPRGDRPYGDKPRFDAPRGEGNFRPREDREPNGNFTPREGGEADGNRSSFGDKPRSDRPFGDKPRGDRPFGDKKKSFGSKPFGDKKFGPKKFGPKKFGAKKPFAQKD